MSQMRADEVRVATSDCAASETQRKSDGERLCEAFAETFEGGDWADAPAWDDFDERQKDRWERTARIFLCDIAVQRDHG